MKTSVEISNPLFEEARKLAAESGVSMRSLIEQGLRKVLDEQRQSRQSFELRDERVDGNGLADDFQGASWTKIRDAAYGEE
ncbi:MAG: DUF2191 domain-containing protein [bacterium]